jgi:hypothetical protein
VPDAGPAAYEDSDEVTADRTDMVEAVHTLKHGVGIEGWNDLARMSVMIDRSCCG